MPIENIERRIDKQDQRLDSNDGRYWGLKEEVNDLKVVVEGLKAWRDNERAKASSTPAWLFGTISAALSIVGFIFSLYLAGIRP